MNTITVESANAMIFHFLQEITKEKELEPKLDPKKDNFALVLPLKNDQAIMWLVGWKDGERDFEVNATNDFDPNKLKQDKVILMPRLKETSLDIYYLAKFERRQKGIVRVDLRLPDDRTIEVQTRDFQLNLGLKELNEWVKENILTDPWDPAPWQYDATADVEKNLEFKKVK